MTHGYIPQPLIKTTIVPNINKYKAANLSSCDNYESIAVANVMSEVFEHLLLLHCEQFLTKVVNPLLHAIGNNGIRFFSFWNSKENV